MSETCWKVLVGNWCPGVRLFTAVSHGGPCTNSFSTDGFPGAIEGYRGCRKQSHGPTGCQVNQIVSHIRITDPVLRGKERTGGGIVSHLFSAAPRSYPHKSVGQLVSQRTAVTGFQEGQEEFADQTNFRLPHGGSLQYVILNSEATKTHQ